MKMLAAVWVYRGFVIASVKREFQSKYRTSVLGAAWTVLNPLAMIVIYTVIFSQIMHAKLPGIDSTFAYSIYLCAGILTWGLFAEITGRAQNIFLENANLIKKLTFPRLCLPVGMVVSAGLNFSIVFGLFTAFLIFSGNFPGWSYIALFPLLALQVLFSVGIGIIVGVLNVFFRDIGQFFTLFLQFWFWLTPIVYPPTILPERFKYLISLNPMTGLVQGYQGIFVNGQWPDWHALWPVATLSFMTCFLGFRIFRKHVNEMVDEL